MAKKTKNTEEKVLTPEEVSKYRPTDDLPKLLDGGLGLGLGNVFDLAKQSGASVIGVTVNNQPVPEVNGSH